MLNPEFKAMIRLIETADAGDIPSLETAHATLVAEINRLVEPDVYTEGAIEGVTSSLVAFIASINQADTLPHFTVARHRYNAREALWALHDELRRQSESS
ncbi:MAG TPA: hypothetical protein VE079_12205 [Ensifer sp.]|nr:hypothetical protein [Ensifer sp.]